MEGLDVYQHYRLNPTEVEAVTYYLPRLIAGQLHGAEKFIHHVDIYDCEPKDLAAHFAPVPQAASSGDRFFFTTRKSKNGSKTQSVRTAGGGTWTVNSTTAVKHAGVEVGERKNLSFTKKGKSTGWVMEEYRCLLPEAIVSDGVKVFCKIHLAKHPPDAARQESAAYKLQEPQREPVTASTHAQKQPVPRPEHGQKRPVPAAAADPHPPGPNKRMRVAVLVSAPATPSFLMYAQAPEISSQSDVLQSTQSLVLESVKHYSQQEIVPEAGSSIARSTSEEDVFEPLEPISNLPDGEADGFDIEELMRMMEDDPIEVEPVTGANTGLEMGQQEPLYLDTLDQGMLEDMLHPITLTQCGDQRIGPCTTLPSMMLTRRTGTVPHRILTLHHFRDRTTCSNRRRAPSIHLKQRGRPKRRSRREQSSCWTAWKTQLLLVCKCPLNPMLKFFSKCIRGYSLADILVRPCTIATHVPLSNLLHLFMQAKTVVVVLLAPVMDLPNLAFAPALVLLLLCFL